MRKSQAIPFALCAFGLVWTAIIAAAISYWGRGASYVFWYSYDALFFICAIVLLVNVFNPVFDHSVFDTRPSKYLILALIVCDILVFQAVASFGFLIHTNFKGTYTGYLVLLQLINLFFLWMVICGIYGQENFPSFFKLFMKNPPAAIGRALGNKTYDAIDKVKRRH